MEHLQRSANESNDDYIYRMLGSFEWVYNVKDVNELPEGTPRDIWRVYCEIREMSTGRIEQELYENEESHCYSMNTVGGAWCRTWCMIAIDELESRRKPKITSKMVADTYRNFGFNVTEDADGFITFH